MRKMCLDMVYELAKKDERIFFIGSDLGHGTLDKFKKEIPERFIMEGISEANVVGIATGLAMEGKIVYVNTIATFLTRRCYEQVVLDACLHNVNIRLIGNGGGLVYAPLGPTHLAIEDITIMRAIPNMTVISVADANEMQRMMPHTVDHKGPIYIRLGKGYDPIVTPDDEDFKIGKAVKIKEGIDALIVTTGITLGPALKANEELKKQNMNATILHMHTIKPLDVDTFLECAKDVSVIVVVEEQTVIGGLGSAIAEVVAEANFQPTKCFKMIGIPDVFANQYGTQYGLMDSYGINAENIVKTVKELQSQVSKLSV